MIEQYIYNDTMTESYRKWKWKWHAAKNGDPYSESVLYIYPSKCTHTAVNTIPVNTPVFPGSLPYFTSISHPIPFCYFSRNLYGPNLVIWILESIFYSKVIQLPDMVTLYERRHLTQSTQYTNFQPFVTSTWQPTTHLRCRFLHKQ